MKSATNKILIVCFAVLIAVLFTACDGGGGGGAGQVWFGSFDNIQYGSLLVAWALSGGSISEGEGSDFVEKLSITFTGTYTSAEFLISGSATGEFGADTFTATGTVTAGALGDSSASGTYSMDFIGDKYPDQLAPGQDWSMGKIE